mmetsp:Transcript_20906/g.62306  ORF Transcript_20906/g.62306 Transcript_20906/m.62306 type:complete len:285 (-) Transcript_20906:1108-1962(-)
MRSEEARPARHRGLERRRVFMEGIPQLDGVEERLRPEEVEPAQHEIHASHEIRLQRVVRASSHQIIHRILPRSRHAVERRVVGVHASQRRPLDDVVYVENGLVRVGRVPAVGPGKDVGVRARLVEPARLQLIVKTLRRLELRVEAVRDAVVGMRWITTTRPFELAVRLDAVEAHLRRKRQNALAIRRVPVRREAGRRAARAVPVQNFGIFRNGVHAPAVALHQGIGGQLYVFGASVAHFIREPRREIRVLRLCRAKSTPTLGTKTNDAELVARLCGLIHDASQS